jgi:dihydroorotate dehydrogenase
LILRLNERAGGISGAFTKPIGLGIVHKFHKKFPIRNFVALVTHR